MRIESCNFKDCHQQLFGTDIEMSCTLTSYGVWDKDMKLCSGEDNCIIFQIYKLLEMNTK